MADEFRGREPGLTAPSSSAFEITPDDGSDLQNVTRGLYVGSSGDVRVLMLGDDTPVTFTGLAGGVTHAKRIRRVYATGTTATGLIGEF